MRWVVAQWPIELGAAQSEKFCASLPPNNRPVQPRNEQMVMVGVPLED